MRLRFGVSEIDGTLNDVEILCIVMEGIPQVFVRSRVENSDVDICVDNDFFLHALILEHRRETEGTRVFERDFR
jgi:hypothetical protein